MTSKRWKQIWKTIGDAFEKPYEKRTIKQHELARYGLCYAIEQLCKSYAESNEFEKYFEPHYFSQRCGMWWEQGCGDAERATIAYFMMTLTLDESKQINDRGRMAWNKQR